MKHLPAKPIIDFKDEFQLLWDYIDALISTYKQVL